MAALAVALCSCSKVDPLLKADAQSVQPPIQLGDQQSVTSNGARLLRLKLTLSSPDDLRVKEGDSVSQGQMLSDRVNDRTRLEAQRKQLQLQIDRLKQAVTGPPPVRSIPELASLPAPTFFQEVAEVERVKLKADQSQRNKELQQRKLDLLQSFPKSELPEATIPHEQAVLDQRQRDVDQANSEVELARAKLGNAQNDRAYQEYLHSLEQSKRAIAIQQQELQRQEQLQHQQDQERDRSFKLAQLEAQRQQLNAQILSLSAIRSPYAGVIQRIKYEGQNDQSFVVELTLAVNAVQSGSGRSQESGARSQESGDRSGQIVSPSPAVSASSSPADGNGTH
jgi:hypothetical protein